MALKLSICRSEKQDKISLVNTCITKHQNKHLFFFIFLNDESNSQHKNNPPYANFTAEVMTRARYSWRCDIDMTELLHECRHILISILLLDLDELVVHTPWETNVVIPLHPVVATTPIVGMIAHVIPS